MQEFLNWTVDTIRQDKIISPWLEEKKFEWTPLVSKNIINVLDKNFSVLIITDSDRDCFLNCILLNINLTKYKRHFLPCNDFRAFFENINSIRSEGDI